MEGHVVTISMSFDAECVVKNLLSFVSPQTISYMAERVVGTGSFGVVFQVI